ncbi:MAG: hypothetical protein LBH74_08215 [Nitrososphaerota archaeon]|nr:hypothetical protein [Nitrososphaerota archaeon]
MGLNSVSKAETSRFVLIPYRAWCSICQSELIRQMTEDPRYHSHFRCLLNLTKSTLTCPKCGSPAVLTHMDNNKIASLDPKPARYKGG